MVGQLLRRLQKHFTALSATILVPVSGAWFTYWERDHSNRAFVRSLYERETEQHQAFIEDISSRLVKGEFEYLDLYRAYDINAFRQEIESEAARLGLNPSEISYLMMIPPSKPLPNLPESAVLSDVFGAKLNLLLGSSRAGQQYSPSVLVSSGSLARETLHFLRRSGLLDYGGLLMEGDLSRLDLRESNLACTFLNRLKLNKTDLSGANLIGTYLQTAEEATKVNFTKARLLAAQLNQSRFSESDFSGSNMQFASLKNATIQDSDFSRADLRDAVLYGTRLKGENNFDGADIRGAVLLYDEGNSANGELFKGAFGNSKPIRLRNGKTIQPTIIPPGLSFDELGIIDISQNNDEELLKAAGTRDGEESRTINLPLSCKWKIDGAAAILEVYRKAGTFKAE